MTLTNRDIADIFERIADMLQIRGDNIHRVLSYRRAGEVIRELPRDLRAIAAEGKLTDIPNIGKTLADKIEEMLETGRLKFYDELAKEIPPGLVDIMRLNGVGPKKAYLFWKALGITDIEALQKAAQAGKLRTLSGMGAKSEQKILDAIESLSRQTGRTPLGVALPAAEAVLEHLLALPEAIEGTVAGSLRRGKPTIGDIDLLIAVKTMDDAPTIMERFTAMDNVAKVLRQGPTKSMVELLNGLVMDLRVLEKARWGTALQYFTGSQAHNVKIRQIALERGYSLNENALRPVDDTGRLIENAEPVLCDTEEAVYTHLGLQWIPPELREDMGEVEAAQQHALPHLISEKDIIADLHMHTTWSDGWLSIAEMAEAARARGRQYIVITDHSQSLGIANGLSVERLLEQQKEVRAINDAMGDDFHIFHGVEMDIKADGTLDYPDEVLAQLDFVIASLHVSLKQPREQITMRLLNAIRNPHVDMIGHPTARQIPKREPVDADMDAVFTAAKEHQTALEINANPLRLDLDGSYARRAVEMGIPLAINTDAHKAEHMDLLHYGVKTARRGWVQAANVINTWPVERFREWLNRGNNP